MYDAVIRWILTVVVVPGRQFLMGFWRQVVEDRGRLPAVHGEFQQIVPVSLADPLRRLGSQRVVLRRRGRHGQGNLTGIVRADRQSRTFLS
jgi:hypothetical protein